MKVFVLIIFALGVYSVSSQVVCKDGQKACGFQCYDKYGTKKCHTGGVLCESYEDACGYQCYTKTAAIKCYPGGILCEMGEKPCGYRCYNPITEKCNIPEGIPPIQPGYPGYFPNQGYPMIPPGYVGVNQMYQPNNSKQPKPQPEASPSPPRPRPLPYPTKQGSSLAPKLPGS